MGSRAEQEQNKEKAREVCGRLRSNYAGRAYLRGAGSLSCWLAINWATFLAKEVQTAAAASVIDRRTAQ